MKSFLREYWAWILTPSLVVLGGLLLLLLAAGGEGAHPFVYGIF